MLTGRAEGLSTYRILAQIIAGVFIGMQLASCDMKSLLRLYKPILVTVVGMLTINVLVGFMLYYTSDMDLITSLFASTPGGIAEMSIISAGMGANTLQVSILQFFRMLSGFLIFPAVAQWVILYLRKKNGVGTGEDAPIAESDCTIKEKNSNLLVLFCGVTAGMLGYLSGFSGGILVFSMVAVGVLGHFGKHVSLPMAVKRVAQVLSGIYIGATSTLADVASLQTLILPLVLLVISYLALSLLLGWILYRFCHLEASAAFFSCIPAGVSDMALIASDFGSGGPIVAVLQLFRFASVVALAPSLILLMSRWLG